jgi:hypothetical protein
MAASCYGEGVKMIGRDFWVSDEEMKPIAFGLCSWTDEEVDLQLAYYINISVLSFWDNHLRFGLGAAFTKPDEGSVARMDMRLMVPAVTTLFFDHLEVGAYASPCYNLYNGRVNDPYGIMVGYAFWF